MLIKESNQGNHQDAIKLIKKWRDWMWSAAFDEKDRNPLFSSSYRSTAKHCDNVLAILELKIDAPSMENLTPIKYGEWPINTQTKENIS